MSLGLAIVGHGKMGQLIEQLAPEYGFDVRATFSSANIASLSTESLNGATIAVEFTTPAAAPENLRRIATLGLHAVSGTTGWFDHLPSIRDSVQRANTGLIFSANFSIGVNLFLQIVGEAAARFSHLPEYEAWGWEIHHATKKDSPSGTLRKLAEEMRTSGYDRPVSLSVNRAGSHPGTHEIGFDSAADTITLRHTARSGEGFARGALQAARWVAGKKGVFEFRDILGQLTSS